MIYSKEHSIFLIDDIAIEILIQKRRLYQLAIPDFKIYTVIIKLKFILDHVNALTKAMWYNRDHPFEQYSP